MYVSEVGGVEGGGVLFWLPDENGGSVEEDGEGEIGGVTVEVAAERWDEVRPDVDALVREWGLRSHVRE